MATADSKTKEDQQDQQTEKPVEPEKHPLQNKWSLWFFKPDKAKKWIDNFKLVTSFATVEDFWAVYNYIKPASSLEGGCDYMLFKDGIQPMWEDPRNRNGGRWLLSFDRRRDEKRLDNCWMETLMCLVGEIFEDSSDDVCGAVVQMRPRGDKIAIWTANSKNKDQIMTIGRSYKEKLELHMRDPPLAYELHKDAMNKSGSVIKALYTL